MDISGQSPKSKITASIKAKNRYHSSTVHESLDGSPSNFAMQRQSKKSGIVYNERSHEKNLKKEKIIR
jgi:hypothetical protein